jgi:TolB-like protein/Tfp pilus assembly protein PilF
MTTSQSGEKAELELLPKELYGNVPRPLHSPGDGEEELAPSAPGGLIEELYDRNVFHMSVLYAILCWVAVEVAPPLFRDLHMSPMVTKVIGGVAVLGFPLTMLFAWSMQLTAWGWTPTGKVRPGESLAKHVRKQLNRAIVIAITIAIGYLLLGKLLFPAQEGEAAATPPVLAPAAGGSTAVAAGEPVTSIAVLAFNDAGEAKDQSYLVNGFSDGLPAALAGLPRLAVTNPDSSLQYRSGIVDATSIGAALGVRYVLEGNVRPGSDRVQVTVQLIDTRDGSQRWTETFERDPGNAFQLRDDVATGVAKALGVPVGLDGIHTRRGVTDANAYDLYLRAREAFRRDDRAGYEQAAELYSQARDLDPRSPAIEAGIAEVNLAMVERGYVEQQAGMERARTAAEHAVSFDAGLAKAHSILATIHGRYEWNWIAAKREVDWANSLDAHDAQVLAERGNMSLYAGRFDSAAQDLQAALALDPLNAAIQRDLARAQWWGGHSDKALASLQRLLQLYPNERAAHYDLAMILLASGDQDGALAESKRESDARHRLAAMSKVFFAMGRKGESDVALSQLKMLANSYGAADLAGTYATRNDTDAALQWLDRAFTQKDEELLALRGDPSFRVLAGDPRYEEFLRKLNLPM